LSQWYTYKKDTKQNIWKLLGCCLEGADTPSNYAFNEMNKINKKCSGMDKDIQGCFLDKLTLLST
jgi:hypothetical protein